jgi:large subunit ribosomal protein L14e
MVEIGRLAVKTAGRDSGNFCVVVSDEDKGYVTIDGNVRRKKCNLSHLEFLDTVLKIKKDEKSEGVKKALEKEGVKILKKGDKRDTKSKPMRQRKKKIVEVKEEPKKDIKEKKEDKK